MSRYRDKRIVGLFLFVTIGCSHYREWRCHGKVGPEHSPPAAEIAAEWQQYNSPYVISAENAVDDACWWSQFQDADLDQFVGIANSNYLPLQVAILRIQERRLRSAIATGNLFPQQQEAFAEYQRIQFSDNGNQIGIRGLGNTFDLYQFGLNASWEIDLWGRLRRIIESSVAEVEASIEDEHDIRLTLTADVVATYTAIRVLQNRIRIAEEQVAAQEETLRIAQARLDNGSASRLDVTQATALVASTRATIPALASELRKANNRLCLLMGESTRVIYDETNVAAIPRAPSQIVIGMPRELLRRRPDIRRAEREIAAQSALVGVSAADLFPALSIRGTVNWQAFKPSDLFESAANAGSIIPGIRWNVLNYGRLKANVAVQRTLLDQAIVRYRQVVLNANTEAEDALMEFVSRNEEISAIRRAVRATQESLNVATRQYQDGNVDLDRVNNLRKDLLVQLDAVTDAQGQAAIALVRVYKTMGGGWTLPIEGDACPEGDLIPQADREAQGLARRSQTEGPAIARLPNVSVRY